LSRATKEAGRTQSTSLELFQVNWNNLKTSLLQVFLCGPEPELPRDTEPHDRDQRSSDDGEPEYDTSDGKTSDEEDYKTLDDCHHKDYKEPTSNPWAKYTGWQSPNDYCNKSPYNPEEEPSAFPNKLRGPLCSNLQN
jgi:hypothetical protein